MGPIRVHKKRKVDKKMEPSNIASGSSEEASADWFDALAKKIASNLNSSPSKGLDSFESMFNMSRKTFEYVCSLAREHMMVKTHCAFSNGKPMSLYDQVALALRRLSSGSSLITIGDSFGTHHSTVSQVTWRFVEAIERKGIQHIRWPSTENELMEIKSKFEQIRGLPNCCGAIDTTHIVMLLSTSEPRTDVWLDSKENHSMPLQAIVGPNMKFLDVFSGLPGMFSESSLIRYSSFYNKCQNGERLGKKERLSEEAELQEYIIGDSAYPLLPWLLTPYQGKELSQTKADFNKRLFATHIVAQRALARLKDVWKIINGVMWRPDKHKLPRFILVCCILHNIIIDMEDEVLDDVPLSHHHDPGYGQVVCNSADETASVLRDKLALYLSERRHP
ncbi:protein ALP1-like isoform X1 [Coffea arabica]|uniref:Protein ALP1-like isoform X1 n=1 Tax=Coffea arabica TaxID=13443 RepID=A0ABM4W0H7_COFAR